MKVVNKVSFIVPVYNVELYLGECLESLKSQEGDVEIILVDDGSTDQSGKMCDDFASEDNRIRVIHKKNEGVSTARNTGIQVATGDWISFVDADDWISHDFCKVLLERLDSAIDIAFVESLPFYLNVDCHQISDDDVECINMNKKQLALFERVLFNKYAMKEKPHLTSACAKVYNKKFLKEFNLQFDSQLCKSEDALFNNYAFFHARKAIWIKKKMYYYRQHESSVTHKFDANILQTYMKHINKLQYFINQYGLKLDNDFNVRVVFDFMYCVVNNYCNTDNPKKYFLRRREFLKAIGIPIFRESFKCVKIEEFSFKEKVLTVCIRHKMFMCINILYKINSYFTQSNQKKGVCDK